MDPQQAPKVFVSHASDDKARFVVDFATRLRQNGVDAWFDQWEIKPGDSLVDKIFEEGIASAEAMIIVLSATSVQKAWVREELNAGVVRRIARQCKIIPVVIDKCEVPESLRSTLYVEIKDLQHYDADFSRIMSAIFDHSEKPPLGRPPRYRQSVLDTSPGLTKRDTTVFKVACETILDTGQPFVDDQQFTQRLHELDVSDEETVDSLHILDDRHLIDVEWFPEGFMPFFKVTPLGFENYGRRFIDNFDDLVKRTMLAILNEGLDTRNGIARHLLQPSVLIEYILDILAERKCLRVSKAMGDDNASVLVTEVTPLGKRFAQSG